MYISRIQITNFRNFASLDLQLAGNSIILGENRIGKSNLLHALRLVLDPSLPDTARQLRQEDFWDGLARPLRAEDKITISVDLADFENDENLVALLAEHLVSAQPMTSRLTYVFHPLETLKTAPASDADYDFFVHGGDRTTNTISHEVRRGLPLDVLPALRDAEGDLANWRRSPLRPLLDAAIATIDRTRLVELSDQVSVATAAAAELPELAILGKAINGRLQQMVGASHSSPTNLAFSPTDPERLLRALRLFTDGGRRSIGEASLGSANLLYLTLCALECNRMVVAGQRHHTFLAIEEPEAHLHPHLQRLVYRDFLRTRTEPAEPGNQPQQDDRMSVLLTTHSPHIASVAPLKSIAVLRKDNAGTSTTGVSTAGLTLDAQTTSDLERYLDVTRGEMLFAKAVLLVEGNAELYVLPALGKALGVDFDQLGITVCSVGGVNFLPYVQLLGTGGLAIPFAIITDGDPDGTGARAGEQRVRALLSERFDPDSFADYTQADLVEFAAIQGLLLGEHTLEVDLFSSGGHVAICDTLIELTINGAARTRATGWRQSPATVNRERLLKDIEDIGKGRFAQRLAGRLTAAMCPAYIRSAVEYARNNGR